MHIRRTITALLGAAALATVAVSSAAAAEPPSVADVLAADGQAFDGNWADFDILERAALTVLDAKPGSPVAALADPAASLTVFAPTDRAFRKLTFDLTGKRYDTEGKTFRKLVGAVSELTGTSKTIDTIEAVLLYHVVPGKVASSAVPALDGQNVATALGPSFQVIVDTSVRLRDKDPNAANARLVLDRLDIDAGNSVIHTIDRVLRPIDLP
jgi:uncharacterized surface protein with fasciclin (FAS1) repeats